MIRKVIVHTLWGAAIAAVLAAPSFAREIPHAMGTTDVPDDPQRIVVLTGDATEAALALGVTPVGAVRSWYGDPWYPHLEGRMDGVAELGTELAVNLELIAELKPDLIIGSKKRHEEVYPQLSAIAPTVFSIDNRDWKGDLGLYALTLGRADHGESLLTDYAADVAALQNALGDSADETVSVVRFVPGQIYIYQQDSFSGAVLHDIGFKRPGIQAERGLAKAVGRESLPDLQADRLFYLTYDTGNGDGEELENETLADPLWQALPVVSAGHAHRVDDGIWATAGGIYAARRMLRDIAAIYGAEPQFKTN